MSEQETRRAPVIVTLPARSDLRGQERAHRHLCAALASGAPLIIADFTASPADVAITVLPGRRGRPGRRRA